MPKLYYHLIYLQFTYSLTFIFYTIAMTLYVFETTGSTFYASLITFLNLSAKITSKFFIHSYTQKFGVKKVLLINTTLQMFIISLLIPAIQLDNLIMIYIVTITVSFFNGMFITLKNTIIKTNISPDYISKTISGISSFDQITMFAGWIGGAWLIAEIGARNTLFLTLLLFITGVMNIALMKLKTNAEVASTHVERPSFTEGWRLLYRQPLLFRLTMIEFTEALLSTLWIGAIQIAYVKEFLNMDVKWWGYISAAYFTGTLAGAIFVYRNSTKLESRTIQIIIVCMFVYACSVIIYGMYSSPIVAVILCIIMGVFIQSKDILQESLIIKTTPEKYITILSAYKSSVVEMGFLISTLVIGLSAELVPIEYVYIIAGILYLLLTLFMIRIRHGLYKYTTEH